MNERIESIIISYNAEIALMNRETETETEKEKERERKKKRKRDIT